MNSTCFNVSSHMNHLSKGYTQIMRICLLNSRLFAVIRIVEIGKSLRDFAIRGKSSLDSFSFLDVLLSTE